MYTFLFYVGHFIFTPAATPEITPIVYDNNNYPAGHTVIIVVCTVMGGLIIVFLAFLILTVCYFSTTKKTWSRYKFSSSTVATPDTSSRLSTASETTPNSVCSLPTRSTNVLDSYDGVSYDSCLKQPHSVSQLSLETTVTREPYHYQPPNTPTSKSVHFGRESVAYRRAESSLTFNDDNSYVGPCPSIRSNGTGDDISYITSVSEAARRRQEVEIRAYRRQQMQQQYCSDTEDYDDTGSITSVDTKVTYNSTNFIGPPPPSLASRSMYMDGPPDECD